MIEIEKVSAQNVKLREKVQRASERLTEINEANLRQIGAELHDGPAQLVGLAALKIEHVRRAARRSAREAALASLERVLSDALQNMRTLARGLVLPEIANLALSAVIRSAVDAHEERTKTSVSVVCNECLVEVSPALRICVYRFVQEGLNNAFRHAGAINQAVECRVHGHVLSLKVSDGGGSSGQPVRPCGLGLTGLRERVESLGGTFLLSQTDAGTTIMMVVSFTQGRDREQNDQGCRRG